MSTQQGRVLVVDDERQIRRLLRAALTADGYEVVEAEDGAGALSAAAGEPDAVILDLGLPDIDGIEIIDRIRDWSPVPIIVLTARDAEAQKIAALDGGADDYVTKPFAMGELKARLRAALRHRLKQDGTPPVFRSGDLEVDLVRRLVRVRGQDVKLSPKEYDLLRLMVQNAGRVLTHQMILKAIWGPAHLHDTQYLRVYVGQLRQKLGDTEVPPSLIITEPGVGYRLCEDTE